MVVSLRPRFLAHRVYFVVVDSTRIRIQTAGLAFGGTGLCSYRVRGVDGICAEHLTVESYTVFICQQSYVLLFGIPSPTHSLFPGLKTFLLCKSFPLQPFLSST